MPPCHLQYDHKNYDLIAARHSFRKSIWFLTAVFLAATVSMNSPRPSTSRLRFAEFVRRFRRGEFNKQREDSLDDNDNENRDPGTRENRNQQRSLRRGYLRLYIRRLWPHWKIATSLMVMALIIAGLELIQPLFLRYIIDQILLSEGDTALRISRLHYVAWIYLGVVLAGQALGIWRSWWQRLLNVRVILTLRRALFERMLRLPLEKLSEMKTGGIISRLTDDINTTTGLLQMAVVSPGVAIVRLLLAMGILLFINWKLALTALAVIPPIMLLSMLFVGRIRPVYRAIRKDVSYVDGRVGEAFQGIRDVRVFSGEHREEQEYIVGHHSITRMQLFAQKREILLWSTWGLLMGLVSVVITWAGGYWYLYDQATIGDISAFKIYTFMLLNPVWQLVESMSELQRSMAAMERVFSVLETPVDKPDRIDAIEFPDHVGEIQLEHVEFSYNGDKNVIHDLNLSIPPGSIVALVGRSGAGKTTLTDLIARFHDPTSGRILVNGIDLRDYRLESWRQKLGVVQQEVFLFDGSVRENIAYARPDATEDQVTQAARGANADQFISQLPDGYDSIIGERGVKLSGGQRQRLAIARALLAAPDVLIFDEATSNLDTESERLIQQALDVLVKGRTTFIIAHRLSTVAHADVIVVIDEGRIVESGTHYDLLESGGLYSEMVRRQQDAINLDYRSE